MPSDLPPSRAPLRGLGGALIEAAGRAGLGIVITTPPEGGGMPQYANATAADLLGYSEPELRTLPLRDLLVGGVRSSTDPGPSLPNPPHSFEAELRRKDGTALTARVAQVALDGWADAPAVLNLVFDPADQHRVERALLTSERRYRKLLDAAPEPVVISDRTGICYANSAAIKMAGLQAGESLYGTDPTDSLHPDDVPAARAHARAVLATHGPQGPLEIRVRRTDGSHLNIEVMSMLTEWDGRPALVHVGRELSRRKREQARLIQSDRLTAVGTLAAGVAHEINNPLAYVLLNLQYLLRELPKLGQGGERLPQLMERLRESQHGAERVSTIVRDLREFSTTEEHEQIGPVDLRRVLDAAVKVAGGQIQPRARLVEHYQELPTVRGNAAKLEQVFLNLLTNAAQALPAGAADANEIHVVAFPDGPDRVVVDVADTGPGIPADLLDRVFDPFFTTKPAGAGTGLGLPICHNIVTSLDGEIGVESELGHGTVFRVVLRTMVRPPPPVQPTPQPFGAVPGGVLPRARILVVDDELGVASMLSRLLASEHDVEVRTSGKEALELLLGDAEFDLVLCDLLMPRVSGMQLFEQLQAKRPELAERVVFMTGGAFTPRASEFISRVPNARIEKPFDLKRVRRLVMDLALRRGVGAGPKP